MSDFWDSIKSLFKKTAESSPSQPAVHEVIERKVEEKEDYEQWKTGLVARRWRDWLADQYAVYRVSPDDIDEALDFLDTPSSKGFVVHLHKTGYTARESIFFLDYLKEQVLTLNYRTQISDRRTYNRPSWVETVERHYVKPRSNQTEGKFDQQYGNIMIELEFRNDRPHNLRFRATSYKDALFHEAEAFGDLMQGIMGAS